MKIKIEIQTDGAAFEDLGPENETARILRSLCLLFEYKGLINTTLLDTNGNRAGSVEVIQEKQETREALK